jgi:ubiquinone/menaquinone biosynthesis C-methylase UbiE
MNMDQQDKESLDEIRGFYDSIYYKDKPGDKSANRHLLKLAERLGICEGTEVLDVACGTGEWLLACQGHGAKTSGVDLSKKAIAHTREKLPDGEFYAQAAETLPFEDNRFDVVSCLGSLEHFVKPEQSIQEMVRTAKDNAQFVLLVPNADFLTRRLGLYSGTNQVDAKEVVRTLDEWSALFERGGVRITERWKDLHVLSLPWIKANGLLNVPIRTAQALALTVWPLKWQYQVYHLCVKK